MFRYFLRKNETRVHPLKKKISPRYQRTHNIIVQVFYCNDFNNQSYFYTRYYVKLYVWTDLAVTTCHVDSGLLCMTLEAFEMWVFRLARKNVASGEQWPPWQRGRRGAHGICKCHLHREKTKRIIYSQPRRCEDPFRVGSHINTKKLSLTGQITKFKKLPKVIVFSKCSP